MYVVRCKLKLHADCIEDSYAATEHQCAAQKSAQAFARQYVSMNVLAYIYVLQLEHYKVGHLKFMQNLPSLGILSC